jgi:glycosyltransferase involved in cell wall biosynthesis
MLSGQSFLVFAPGPWDDMWRNRHQIMSRLARANTILWVEPRLGLRQTGRAVAGGERLTWLPRVEHIRDGLYVLHNPAALPASGPRLLSRAWDKLYRAVVRRTLHRLGIEHPILWLYLPEMAAIIGQYGERLVVYHVVDEYTAYGGVPESYIPAMRASEERLLSRADVVITTAPALFESKSRLSSNVHLVSNAVDAEAFERILAGAQPPPALTALPQPVIGYVGAVNDKLDYSLLRRVATSRPDWSLAMVGPVRLQTAEDKAGYEALRGLPNVHVLGQVALLDVPRYMAACAVCLLPYKINERTRNISSLKMYEYLACGKPVVSTDVPAAHEVGEVVRIAGAESFVSAIADMVHDDPEAPARRRHVAAANTWDQRVETISDILQKKLQ